MAVVYVDTALYFALHEMKREIHTQSSDMAFVENVRFAFVNKLHYVFASLCLMYIMSSV